VTANTQLRCNRPTQEVSSSGARHRSRSLVLILGVAKLVHLAGEAGNLIAFAVLIENGPPIEQA
jgi:hypothetical protein